MAKSKEAQERETTFAEKIGVMDTSVNRAGDAVQLCLLANIPILLIGASSTAKTAKVRELGLYNKARVLIYSLASKEAQDLTGPQFPNRDGTYTYLRDGQVPVMYEPGEEDLVLLQHVLYDADVDYAEFTKDKPWAAIFKEAAAMAKEELKNKVQEAFFRARSGETAQNEPVLLFVDEVNRGDRTTLNAAMTFWAERKIGTRRLGPNVRIVAAMNPPGEGYAVNSVFSTDSAMRRRLVQVGVVFNGAEFKRFRTNPNEVFGATSFAPVIWDALEDAAPRPFHPTVNKYLDQNMGMQYDEQRYAAGQVYACPATWQYASDILYAFDEIGASIESVIQRDALKTALAGCVSLVVANDLITSYEKFVESIDPMDLCLNFNRKTNPKFVERIEKLADDGNTLVISEAAAQAAKLVMETPPSEWDYPRLAASLAEMFDTLPLRLSRAFTTVLYDNPTEEQNKRVLALYSVLPAQPLYAKYIEKVAKASQVQSNEIKARKQA